VKHAKGIHATSFSLGGEDPSTMLLRDAPD
jgi:hypothetical protein